MDLLSGPVLAHSRRKLAGAEDAQDVAQDALLAVLEKAHQCRAVDYPMLQVGERMAWAWAFTVVDRKISDLRTGGAREQAAWEEAGRLFGGGTLEVEAGRGMLEELLWTAEQGVVELIETRKPDDLYRDARASQVASEADTVRRDIDSFLKVKLYGRRCLGVGRERGYEGPDLRVQNFVSKQVERGKKAMAFGAWAAARMGDDAERERLEHFALGLLQVGKLS